MATVRHARAMCEKLGGNLSDDSGGRYWTFNADLPAGKTWNANGLHTLCATTAKGDASWKAEMFDDLIERMSYGVDDSPGDCGPDCEICHPANEEA